MFNLSDTICAICTPPGTGGLAAIRISGPESWEIASKFFSSHLPSSISYLPFNHMQALHGFIKDNEKIIDEVILLPYKSPQSFTTEDTIEIFCHGGNQIASMILDLCLKNGARLAEAGEFTFRAFINGRIDLTEAEAINEIIYAESEKAVFASSDVLCGTLKEKVKNFRERLFNLITSIEGSIEFPNDVESQEKEKIVKELKIINNELTNLIDSSKEGQILREGVKVSIIGAPNVGKSSLLNCLLENQRAIVTSEAGTTRDTIEEKIIIDGYPVVLVDTAGLREHKFTSESEKLGIERSKQALERSDLALIVTDLTKQEKTNKILNLVNGKPGIIVGNKLDLIEKDGGNCDVAISAKYGTNIDKLKKLIIEKVKFLAPISHLPSPISFYINQRQKELLMQCSSSINFAIEISKRNDPEDLIADELKKAVSRLDEISGIKVNEEIIQNIFSKFCIGK